MEKFLYLFAVGGILVMAAVVNVIIMVSYGKKNMRVNAQRYANAALVLAFLGALLLIINITLMLDHLTETP